MGRPGEFEVLVLLAALRLGPDDAYAVSIAEEIGARTGRRVGRASVYTALGRMEEKGLVTTRMGDPRPERGGKARRLVVVEAPGLTAVREATTDLRAMLGGLEGILEGGV